MFHSCFNETCNVTYDALITYSKVKILIAVQRKRLSFLRDKTRVDPLPVLYAPENADRTSLLKDVLNNLTLEMCKILAHVNIRIVFKFFF
jgi:hypothetical protein